MTSRLKMWRLLPVRLALLGLVVLPYLCHSAAAVEMDDVIALVSKNSDTFTNMSSSMWKIGIIFNLVHSNERMLKRKQEANNFEGGYNHTVAVETLENEVRNLTEKLNSIQSYIDRNQGNPGMPGKPGENGFFGSPGQKGEGIMYGIKGNPGDIVDGITGESGISGIKGKKGEDGIKGAPGNYGSDGSQGTRGPRGDKGLDSR